MASSLGAAFGVAISAAIFSALSGQRMHWLEGVITFQGRANNLALREAGVVALAFNLIVVVLAIVSIVVAVPAGKPSS
jgi:DHA2 family multidrug resistance protein-like MFS transporter